MDSIAARKRKTALDKARLALIPKVIEVKTTGMSNRYCAWVASSRRYTEKGLFAIIDDVKCASGGRTKYNRETLGLPKEHHYDALCVGTIPAGGYTDLTNGYWLTAKAIGRGSRMRGRINKCGIITHKLQRGPKRRFGFQNGDIVAADASKGKYAGTEGDSKDNRGEINYVSHKYIPNQHGARHCSSMFYGSGLDAEALRWQGAFRSICLHLYGRNRGKTLPRIPFQAVQ